MLKGKNVISLLDFERYELEELMDLSFRMKEFVLSNSVPKALAGKAVALLFEKPSTRTRASTQAAINLLGGYPMVFNKEELQWSRGEPPEDTARVLSRYVDAIAARVLKHETLFKLAIYSKKPTVNLLSNINHPLQTLADYMTIKEKFGRYDVKLAFVGDGGDNIVISLMEFAAKMGLEIHVASPKELRPSQDIWKRIEEEAERSGAIIEYFEDPYEAVRGVHAVYTDVWVSMGEESIAQKKIELLKNYRVTSDLMKYASKDAIFLHCLPAYRGQEVDADVIDGPQSAVWDEAENRLYTAMAVFAAIIP